MLSQYAHATLVNIGKHSDGYRLAVPVGFEGVPRFAVEELARAGFVEVEWATQYDPNLANSQGWCARLTDAGIDYLRIDLRDGAVHDIPDSTPYLENEDRSELDLFMEGVLSDAGLKPGE